jgi:hypothetical protein
MLKSACGKEATDHTTLEWFGPLEMAQFFSRMMIHCPAVQHHHTVRRLQFMKKFVATNS